MIESPELIRGFFIAYNFWNDGFEGIILLN